MTIEDILRKRLSDHDELQGTEQIALDINARKKYWLIRVLRHLEQEGFLEIILSTGGRGNKTIYKRNRNSPGLPRKIR